MQTAAGACWHPGYGGGPANKKMAVSVCGSSSARPRRCHSASRAATLRRATCPAPQSRHHHYHNLQSAAAVYSGGGRAVWSRHDATTTIAATTATVSISTTTTIATTSSTTSTNTSPTVHHTVQDLPECPLCGCQIARHGASTTPSRHHHHHHHRHHHYHNRHHLLLHNQNYCNQYLRFVLLLRPRLKIHRRLHSSTISSLTQTAPQHSRQNVEQRDRVLSEDRQPLLSQEECVVRVRGHKRQCG